MPKTYRIEIEYTFKGYFDIVADTKEEAKKELENNCGISLGEVGTGILDKKVTDYNFPILPEEKIKSIKLKR